MKRVSGLVVLVLSLVGSVHAEEIKDIALEKCDVGHVLMDLHFESLNRTIETQKAASEKWHKLLSITERHPNRPANRPVEDFLTKPELGEFANVSAQIAVMNLYLLAESRLQRDTGVISQMLEAAAKMRDGAHPPDKKSGDFKYYAYLGALREAFKGVTHPDAKNTAECSIDLALERDLNADFGQISSKLEDSKEYLQVLGLRSKYGLANGVVFDTSKMSKTDATRLPELQRYVQNSLSRLQIYAADMSNLRYYAEIVQLQFDELKAEVLQLGPSQDVAEFNKLRAMKFSRLSKPMQGAWNLWDYIDGEIPSQQTKNSKQMDETIRGKSKTP